jgi:predicted component of type VI protein secretion system
MGAEEEFEDMSKLKRKLMAVAIGVVMSGVVSTSAFAQKRGDDKRPPKPRDTKVVVEPKGKPPQNPNQGGKKNDGKKGRP